MITKSRTEYSNIGKYDLTNRFYTCSNCKQETNSVQWFIEIKDGTTTILCPVCGCKHIEEYYGIQE